MLTELLRRGRHIARRASWGLADQAMSSLTNFGIGILIARSLGPRGLGAFTFAFAAYLLALGVTRAVGSEPLVVRFSDVDVARWRQGLARSTGVALVVGVAGAAVCTAVGVWVQPPVSGALLAVGLTLPGLLVQDAYRLGFFPARRGGDAFANDLLWGVLFVAAFASVAAAGAITPFSATLAWGASATAAAVVGAVRAGVVPAPSQLRQWWQQQRDLIPRFVSESAALNAEQPAILWGMGAVANLTTVGTFQAGRIVVGPFRVLSMGLQLTTTPEAVTVYRRSRSRFMWLCASLSLVLGASAVAFGTVLLLLPTSVGQLILGESWLPAREVLWPLALAQAGVGLKTGAAVGLRAIAAARESLRARLMTTAPLVAAGIGGAAIAGAKGAAWGLAIVYLTTAGMWWWWLRHALHRRSQRAADVDDALDAARSGVAT